MCNISSNRDHRILDNSYTDKPELVQDRDKNLILETIESKITARKCFSKESTLLNNEKFNDDSFKLSFSNFKSPNNYYNYISKSQNWIGHITNLSKTKFTAKLIDKNKQDTYEIAQFDIEEVSVGDLSLLSIGALFYWSVGYAHENGQVKKFSLIRFKRVASISEDDFDSIIDVANRLNSNLKWD